MSAIKAIVRHKSADQRRIDPIWTKREKYTLSMNIHRLKLLSSQPQTTDTWCLDSEFYFFKMSEMLFWENNAKSSYIYGGTVNKMSVESTTGNNSNTPKFIWPICPINQNWYVGKKTLLGVRNPWSQQSFLHFFPPEVVETTWDSNQDGPRV